ncbi:retrotransposon protein, putative, ty1-copia subclass [Tanacetum coccineum]
MKKIPQMKSGVVFAMASAKPLPPAPVALAGQHVAPEILAAHTAWVKGSKEIAGLMLMTMEPEIQRNLENLPYANTCEVVKSSCLHQQAEQELLQTTAVNFTRLRPRHLKRNSPRGGGGSTCSQVAKEEKERGGGPSGAGGGVQGCFGLRASRKLKPGALSLYVGNGQREAVEAIGNFELSFPKEDTHPSIDTSLNHEEDDLEIDEPQSDIILIRRSTRTRRTTDRMCLYIDAEEHELGDLGEPANYKAALLDLGSDKWLNAMNVEMQSMKDNEVWDLVGLPPNGKTVGSKWLFKKKTDIDGAVHTYKARLVAKGYTQTRGIDYKEAFSPVADIRAIRILIAIATFYDYEI